MARSSTMTSYSVSLNLEHAVQEIEKLKNRVKELTDKMSLLKQKMNDPSTWGPKDTKESLGKQYYRLEKDLDGVIKTYEQGVKRVKGIDSTLETISGASYDTLTNLRTTLTNSLKRRKRDTDDQIKAYEEAAKRLQKVRDEIAKRDIDVRGGMTEQKAKEVVASPKDYSQSELQDAIKVMEKLRDMQVMGGKQWKEYATQVENANKVLDAFKDKVKLDAMTAQFKDLGNISEKALSEQKKYWQEMVAGAANGSKELEQYEKNLAKVVAEEQKRTKEQAGKVMNNLTDYSVTEIKEAIKATEQLRDAQKPGSKAWAEYAAQVKNASDYLDSFKNKAQLEAMNTQFKNLGKLSADALAEQKKYWQSMVNGAANGSKELEQYRKKLAQVTEEERKRSAASVKNVMANPAKYSVNEIKEAIKVTEQLRDAQQPGSKQWKEYATQVENANKVLESFKDKAKMEAMLAQFRSLGTLSKSAIAEQKKFWQAMADGAEKGSKELETYEHRLKMIQKEENLRARSAGKDLANDILSGSWTGTVGEAKEAVKVLKEYKDTLSTTDTAGIKRVDKAISELNSKTKLAEAGFKSTSEALNALVRQTKNLGNGNFKGSIAELEEMRRKLITIRETQDKVLSARDRDRLTKAIQRVDKELGLAKGDLLDIDHILANMRDTPLKTLERAAQQLQSEIRDCSEATTDFTEKAAKLRRVNAQVDKLKKSFKEKESVISRTAKRLAAYVAIYGGFNFVLGKIKEMIQANLQLSDSFADVQKTTGLTAEQVKDLSKSIDSIDTRTSQQQLHELAAVAGQLGLKSQTDILGFVKASNMISVSLNELGSEGTSSLMKIATLTGEASAGTEQALLKIGSAINELTANSAATAGPIVDLMNRMGGVASQAGLTSAQMAAIGATADALGQSMEITGTSMNKFVTTLMSSSDDIAYALNMDAKALRDMLDSGNTMEAIVAVFERMNKMKGMGELAGIMGELGSEGARMTQVLTAMAKNVNFLKAQIDLSTEAYKEADSIQNEYNIKNENALAIWQRIGNMIKELFVNSFFVDILTGISRGIHNVLSLVIESEYFFKILASSIAAVTAALYANSAAWVKNLNAMGLAKGFETLMHTIGDKFMAVWDTMAGAVSGGAKSFAKFTKEAWAAAEGTNAFKKATDMLGTSLKKLGSFLSRNWLTITIAALAALVAWLVTAATRTTELTRAIARYRREIEEEKNQVDALFTSLNRLNNTEADRAKIIDTINRKYGDYLGFMISEKDSAEKLAAAHKLINSELERRMALNLQNTLQGKANNVYAEKYEEETMAIERTIKGEGLFSPKIFKGKVSAGDVNSFVSKLVNDAVTAAIDNSGDYRKLGEIDEDVFMESVKEAMIKKFNYAETSTIKDTSGKMISKTVILGEQLFDALEGNIEDLLEARVEYMEDIIDAERTADLEMGRITKNATKDRQDMLKVTEKEIEQLQNTTIQDSWTEEQTQEHYSKLLNALRGYVDQSETIRKSMTDDEKKLYEQSMIEKEKAYKTYYDKIAPLAGEDPWGKNLNVKDWKDFADVVTNLDTSSADALVSAYKKLTEDTAKIPSNVKAFYKMFEGTGLETKLKLQDPKDIATQVHNWAEQIKNKLKDKYGRNTSGAFIFDSDGGSGGKKTAKQMYDGWLAALEAYYNERETIIRQRGMEQNKLESEIARELEDLNAEKLASQRELEEGLLNDLYKGSTFDPKKFKGVITGTDYFANLTLESMRAIVSAGGPKLDAVIRKNLTDRMVKLEEQAYKIKQRIEKILLEDDFSEQVAQQYLDSIDKLGLLFNLKTETSDHSEEEGERRLAYMREWSKESYSLTAKNLQDKMEANAIFGDWVKNRTSEDYEALLIQLRKFHDDQEEAERKAAERRKKIFDRQWEVSGNKRASDIGVEKEEADLKAYERFNELGLVSDYSVDEAQIELYRAKIKASQDYIEQIKKEMEQEILLAKFRMEDAQAVLAEIQEKGLADGEAKAAALQAEAEYQSLIRQQKQMTLDSENNIAEQRQLIAEKEMDIEKRKMDTLKLYTDTLSDFAQQMGEAAWGSVEDRQEAGKALLANVLKISKDLLQTYLIEVSTRKMMNDVEIANERYKQAQLQMIRVQSLASTGATMIGEMEAGAALSAAQIELNSAEAASKEAAKKGWIGLAIGAAISVALSALLGAALGRINKAKGEVAAATGASTGRLATGMLTYAEGNYPVLGNDGQVYNAKYEGAGMKTGIYGGGAHFGIFSEKKPEAIIDGDTTQRLILNHPDIWQSIVTLSKTGRLDRGMRTFASGNINELARTAQEADATAAAQNNEQMLQMQATMAATQAAVMQLTQVLNQGIHAKIDMYGDGGMYKSMKKAESFASKRGYR